MKPCPQGAIVSLDELRLYAAACELAAEALEIDLVSNEEPDPSNHDAAYLNWKKSITDNLREYQKAGRKLEKFIKKRKEPTP